MENYLMTTDDGKFEINLMNAVPTFSSLVPKTQEEKVDFFNAINNPQKKLKSCINMTIALKDIYAEECEFVNAETGEVSKGVRMVLIDAEGVTYQASSKGVFTSMSKLLSIMGHPNTWKKPVNIVPKLIDKGTNRQVLVFELAK